MQDYPRVKSKIPQLSMSAIRALFVCGVREKNQITSSAIGYKTLRKTPGFKPYTPARLS